MIVDRKDTQSLDAGGGLSLEAPCRDSGNGGAGEEVGSVV